MSERTQLSPKAAGALGLLVVLMGFLVIGMALRIIPADAGEALGRAAFGVGTVLGRMSRSSVVLAAMRSSRE